MRHLDEVLSIMKAQPLYAKESKCEFGMIELLYLGHIISAQGVQVHRENIRARVEEFLWVVQLLQAVCLRFFSSWSTVDGYYQAWGFHLDQGIKEIL
jgi:hypothetical protein